MSEDYRGKFERPMEPVEKPFFPTLPRLKTEIAMQEEVIEVWEALVEKRKALEPYDTDLVKHTENRLQAHLAELERLIFVEPSSPQYSTTRMATLKECLTRYVNADEIVNVKAVIKAFEDKVLGNYMDQWTIFYNGKIVDRINSYRELLWSVRNPLYKEIYGPKGSIWIEPPTNDLGKACAMIQSPQFVSGAHWYVKQNICLPWYQEKYALELDFLLDSGATDPLVDDKDLLDLGLVKTDCPHVTNRGVSTASGKISVDFYPLLIQHLDTQTLDGQGNKLPLYPFMDTIIGTTVGHVERLSGLDIYRFCYVASEPSTGRCSYHPRFKKLAIRRNIAPGGAMTPRAWFTRTWDNRTQRYTVSSKRCSLTGRQPRLLNPDGDRWIEGAKEYPYQYGREDRSPYRVGYIPGHKVHPPTPDSIRDDRKYYWSRGLAYRDDRNFVAPRVYATDKLHYPRDQYYDYRLRKGGTLALHPTPRPLNPWQFKAPQEDYRQPTGQLTNLPLNPPGVMYWDRQFPVVANRLNLDSGIVLGAGNVEGKTKEAEVFR
ncbi:hypothetical protein BGX38DRAFT_1153559 [Terfezia claveryi]|nr:hypothetical protein BGX38DRAFT_1153559 [Terfezia claveryi]